MHGANISKTEEIFPWDFLDCGITKEFLLREWKKAKSETVSPNCRIQCQGCGANRFGGGVCFEEKNASIGKELESGKELECRI